MLVMPKRIGLLVALAALLVPLAASAQTEVSAELGAPNTDAFPLITASLSVHDTNGFISGLTAADVTVLEDGAEIAPLSLAEQMPGAQIVLAVNASPAFSVQDSNGLSRYDYARQALLDWMERRGSAALDDLSLLSTAGENTVHTASYPALRAALQDSPDDHRDAIPNLTVLASAIDLAQDTTPRPGMGRAILFLTPNPDSDTLPAFPSLTERARQAGVRVHIWMITSSAFFNSAGAQALRGMADQTGGSFFAYSGSEPIPDPETYFNSLRSVYLLTYQSRIRADGDHTLAVRLHSPAFTAETPSQTFPLAVLPPNPILINPPAEITRALVPDAEGSLSETRRAPATQTIEILIEFPDGFPRGLQRTTLYVDGAIAAENTAPPFDQFTWDLTALAESGRHILQVEALDTLGLSSVSIQTPVDVTVPPLPQGFVPRLASNRPLLTTLLVILASGALIAILLRLRKRLPGIPGAARRAAAPLQPAQPEPITRPAPSRMPRWASRLQWTSRTTRRGEPLAFLERLIDPNSLEALTPSPPFPIHATEITIGTDPNLSTFVLDDPAVAELHARIHRTRDGDFLVNDNDTIAGTWVNYQPVNGDNTRLDHGDLIHFAGVGFRFKLGHPPQPHPLKITPEEPT
jgi:hypothetical protein